VNPNAGLDVNPDTLAVDRNVVDGLQIRHSVEENVLLCGRAAVRNRAQSSREREALGGKVQFQDVVAGRRGRGNWIRERRRGSGTIGPEDGIEAVAHEISRKRGEWAERRERCARGRLFMICAKFPE
jgi:hypothetical protein